MNTCSRLGSEYYFNITFMKVISRLKDCLIINAIIIYLSFLVISLTRGKNDYLQLLTQTNSPFQL